MKMFTATSSFHRKGGQIKTIWMIYWSDASRSAVETQRESSQMIMNDVTLQSDLMNTSITVFLPVFGQIIYMSSIPNTRTDNISEEKQDSRTQGRLLLQRDWTDKELEAAANYPRVHETGCLLSFCFFFSFSLRINLSLPSEGFFCCCRLSALSLW